MSKTTEEFQKQISILQKALSEELTGKTIKEVILVPLKNISKEKRGLFQSSSLLGFLDTSDQLYCINVERLLYEIWNKTKQGEI